MRTIKRVLLGTGILLLLLAAASLFFININFGVVIIGAVAGVFILYGLFLERIPKLVTVGLLAVCAVASALVLFLCIYGLADNATYDEDAVIVLGCAVRGERVSKPLAYRLDRAVAYHAANPEAVLVVSGAQGFQESITEALAMERYLVARGVPQEKIIKEQQATSTYENLLFSRKLLDARFDGAYRTVVITNDFHVYRATQIAKALGYSATHLHARTDWYSLPLNYSRECAAVVKTWLGLDAVFSKGE